MTAISAIS